ncbi:hypothetical protein QQS21_005639 [Conoideocrella luteorostrata]|uniref:Uncharacterized protein n=1 Tax=Conoideocrella luteorostrata TaxID=1105319 RepID=A0AAJ0G0S2_9HYPO|nr:hypothetical protein QQS21_005639 [Conoideocrella luteorostrata]
MAGEKPGKKPGKKPGEKLEILTKRDAGLNQQYGGFHTGSWVDKLPSSWALFVQLTRLSPPVGVFLVLFPHLFGVLHASILRQLPFAQTLRVGFSNAIHGWNDLVDAPIDEHVTRTKNRPIVRGAMSSSGAFLFTTSQPLCGLALLPTLPRVTAITVVPSIVVNFYYPFSKRHTYFAQFVLGVSLAWGVVVGAAAMGVVPW